MESIYDQLAPTWVPVGSKTAQLGPKFGTGGAPEAKLGPTVQPEPILRTQCDTLKTWIFAAISVSNVFWLCGGFVRGPVPHIGPVLGPTSAPDAPTQGRVAHVKPNLRPSVPKLRHVGSQFRRVRHNLGQGQPNLTPARSVLVAKRLESIISPIYQG